MMTYVANFITSIRNHAKKETKFSDLVKLYLIFVLLVLPRILDFIAKLS